MGTREGHLNAVGTHATAVVDGTHSRVSFQLLLLSSETKWLKQIVEGCIADSQHLLRRLDVRERWEALQFDWSTKAKTGSMCRRSVFGISRTESRRTVLRHSNRRGR